MIFSREKILETLEKILAVEQFSKFYFAEKYTGKERIPYGCSFTYPRLTFVIDGHLQLDVGSGDRSFKAEYKTGETLVMKPYCITGGRWNRRHETLGLVLNPEYLRIVHAVHHVPDVPLNLPTDYYHLKDSLRICTSHAINAVCELHEGAEANALAPDMLRSAFTLLLADIRNSVVPKCGKAYALWNKLADRIIATFPEQLSRKELADHFMITETYVSRLFSKYAGMTYKEYLRKHQMNKAVRLLDETNMTVEEIAWHCGFQSSSYFIRTFKAANKISPGLRRRLKK